MDLAELSAHFPAALNNRPVAQLLFAAHWAIVAGAPS